MPPIFAGLPVVFGRHRPLRNPAEASKPLARLLPALLTCLALLLAGLSLTAAAEGEATTPKAKHLRDIDSDRGHYVQVTPQRWHKVDASNKVLEVLEEIQRTRYMADANAPDYIYLRSEASGDRIIFDLKTASFKWTAFSEPENIKPGKILATKNGLEPQVPQIFTNVDDVSSFQAGRFIYQYMGDRRWNKSPMDGVGAQTTHRVDSQNGSVIELYHYDEQAQAGYGTTVDLKERRIWIAPGSEAAKQKLIGLETGKFEITNLNIRHGQDAGTVVTMSVQQAIQKNAEVLLKFNRKYLYHQPGAPSFSLRSYDQADAANYRFRFIPLAPGDDLIANDKYVASAPDRFVHIKSNSGAYLSVINSSIDEVKVRYAATPKTLERSETFEMVMDRDRSTIRITGSQAVIVDDSRTSDTGKGLATLPTKPLVTNANFVIERPPNSLISLQLKADPQGSAQRPPGELVNKVQLELVLQNGSRLAVPANNWSEQVQATTQGGFRQYAVEYPALGNVAFGQVVRVALSNLNPNDNILVRSVVTRDYESFFCNCVVHPKTATDANTRVITTDASKATFASAAFWLDDAGLQVSPTLLRSNADVTEYIGIQKKSAMSNTPAQRNVGKFLFDRLAVTNPEKVILDNFISAYDGDFIADYLSIGNQGPGYDNFKLTINTALGKVGAGGDAAALNDMRSELITLANNRRVAKRVMAANRDFLQAKYALAEKEIGVFREYANIQASETGGAQNDSNAGSITLNVLLTVSNIADLNPVWGSASAVGRAAVSLIEAIGLIADSSRGSANNDNTAKDLNGVKNDMIQASNLLQLQLEVQKKNELARLDQLESAFIADVSLLAAVADEANDQVFDNLKITAQSQRSVRREIWSALLPLKTSLVGVALHEDRAIYDQAAYQVPIAEANIGSTLKMARQKFQACAASIALDSAACKAYQDGEFYGLYPDRTRFMMYSQSVPMYSQASRCKTGQRCSSERSSQMFGWALLVKPWRLPVTDNSNNGNDRSNFGEALISREQTLASGRASAQQIDLNTYISDLFESPTALYQMFMTAGEAWGGPGYENITYTPDRGKIIGPSKQNSPENLQENGLFAKLYVGRGKFVGKLDSVGTEFALATRFLDLSKGTLLAQNSDPANSTAYAKYYQTDFSWLPKDFGGGHNYEFKHQTVVIHPLPHRIFWFKDGKWAESVDPLAQSLATVSEP